MRLMSGDFHFIDCMARGIETRQANHTLLAEAINSEIFSYSLRDFLSLCLVTEFDKRASAQDLLGHIWIREMEAERLKQQELRRALRKNFANRFKANYGRMRTTSKQEWDIYHMLEQYDILEQQFDELADMFDALDLGHNGLVQIDEVVSLLSSSGLLSGEAQPELTGSDEHISIEEARTVLAQFD